jgi:MYXO-CTERM domain-containing protein
MTRAFCSLMCLGLFLVSADAARADLILGGTGSPNALPFGNNSPSGGGFYTGVNSTGEYQQIYSGSLFPTGATIITGLGFQSNSFSNGTYTYNLTISLGNTTANPANPSITFANNETSPLTTVFSGTAVASLTNNPGSGLFDLQFTLTTPFVFNPTNGNLLLDVMVSSVTGPTTGEFFTGGFTSGVGRVYNFQGSNGTTGGFGLLTDIQTGTPVVTGPTSAPEPATLTLAAIGAIGLCGFVRRRRRS